jgi:hypothetical protein
VTGHSKGTGTTIGDAGGATTPAEGGIENRPLTLPPSTGTVGGLGTESELPRSDEPSWSSGGDSA